MCDFVCIGVIWFYVGIYVFIKVMLAFNSRCSYSLIFMFVAIIILVYSYLLVLHIDLIVLICFVLCFICLSYLLCC